MVTRLAFALLFGVGVVFAALLSMCTPTFAIPTGNKLLTACEAAEGTEDRGVCKGYIMGVIDQGDDVFFCIPAGKGITYRQAADMALKTLRDVPSIRNEPANTIITAVMMSAFPCAETKSKTPQATM